MRPGAQVPDLKIRGDSFGGDFHAIDIKMVRLGKSSPDPVTLYGIAEGEQRRPRSACRSAPGGSSEGRRSRELWNGPLEEWPGPGMGSGLGSTTTSSSRGTTETIMSPLVRVLSDTPSQLASQDR